jgi:hypothetical protein
MSRKISFYLREGGEPEFFSPDLWYFRSGHWQQAREALQTKEEIDEESGHKGSVMRRLLEQNCTKEEIEMLEVREGYYRFPGIPP